MSQRGAAAPGTAPVPPTEALGPISGDAGPLRGPPARLVCPFRLGLDHMEPLPSSA